MKSPSSQRGAGSWESKYWSSVKMTTMCDGRSKLQTVIVRDAINICTATADVTLQMSLLGINAVSDKDGSTTIPTVTSHMVAPI
jgi:hypothetical protein